MPLLIDYSIIIYIQTLKVVSVSIIGCIVYCVVDAGVIAVL